MSDTSEKVHHLLHEVEDVLLHAAEGELTGGTAGAIAGAVGAVVNEHQAAVASSSTDDEPAPGPTPAPRPEPTDPPPTDGDGGDHPAPGPIPAPHLAIAPVVASPAPTVGRIVHYVYGEHDLGADKQHVTGEHRPAMVVRVWNDDLVNLQVFTDQTNDGFAGTLWRTSRHYDESGKPGTWHWPERG